MSPQSDVAENLVAMDDKLRELAHELSVLATAPEPTPSPPALETAPDRSHLPLAAAAADQARAIIAGAQEEAARIVGDAAQRVGAITAQIDDLQRLRDELERSARALVEEYAAALSHVGQSAPEGPDPPIERPEPGGQPQASPVHPPLW
ncbi:MAG: hypothetical protein M3Z33_10230 [Actinomycetota bacterium]|nr:hypothetical protein [Actinomycetota bacterium]